MIKRKRLTVSESYKIESEIQNYIYDEGIDISNIISIQESINNELFEIIIFYKG